MKKMNKIFGAAAIVGLFLLSTIVSTSLANEAREEPLLSVEEAEYQMMVQYLKDEGLSQAEIDQLVAEALEAEANGGDDLQMQPSLGPLGPDPYPKYVDKHEFPTGHKIEVLIRNKGRTFIETFTTRVVIIKWPLFVEDIHCTGMIRWGAQKVFTRSLGFPQIKHWTIVKVDYYNHLKEGVLGELNNWKIVRV